MRTPKLSTKEYHCSGCNTDLLFKSYNKPYVRNDDSFICSLCLDKLRGTYSQCNVCSSIIHGRYENPCMNCDYTMKELSKKISCIDCGVSIDSRTFNRSDYDEILFKALYKLRMSGEAPTFPNSLVCESCTRKKDNPTGITFLRESKMRSRLTFGVEIEAYFTRSIESMIQRAKLNNKIYLTTDGSLRGRGFENYDGYELVTPACDLLALKSLMRKLTEAMATDNVRVNSACGLHVHCSFPPDRKKIIRLLKVATVFEPLLYAVMPADRSENIYCVPLRAQYPDLSPDKLSFIEAISSSADKFYIDKYLYKKNDLNSIAQDRQSKNLRENHASLRYCGINLHSIFYRGTLEFRMHEGTIDYYEIMRWCYLINRLVKYILFSNDTSYSTLASIQNPKEKYNEFSRILGLSKAVSDHFRERIARFKNWQKII